MSQHMSIGNKLCCGVLEIYPDGEFSNGRFFPNMVRKMGIHYERIDVLKADSFSDGARVSPKVLASSLDNLMQTVLQKPSCVLPAVLTDPYLEK